MKRITEEYWLNYIKVNTGANKTAAKLMERFIASYGTEDMDGLMSFAYGLVTKYGEASAALSCEVYESIAKAQGVSIPDAEPAETASFEEVAKAVRGAAKRSPQMIPDTVGRLVKQAGADTTLKNALRDGAYFAWVPHGDTCPFCSMLAGNGWQRASKKTVKGDHAEHIHANCDCEFAVSFTGPGNVEGYDPDKYLEMYENAEGATWQEKLNSMRRGNYAANPEKYRRQSRETYARRASIASEESQYKEYLRSLHEKSGISLRKKHAELLEKIPNRGEWVELRNKQVNIKDLAALTAYTGDEFALFTNGHSKILIHGGLKWEIPQDAQKIIFDGKYIWEGHSHPTFVGKIMASEADVKTLSLFTWQKKSFIIDLNGKVEEFTGSMQDWYKNILGIMK